MLIIIVVCSVSLLQFPFTVIQMKIVNGSCSHPIWEFFCNFLCNYPDFRNSSLHILSKVRCELLFSMTCFYQLPLLLRNLKIKIIHILVMCCNMHICALHHFCQDHSPKADNLSTDNVLFTPTYKITLIQT